MFESNLRDLLRTYCISSESYKMSQIVCTNLGDICKEEKFNTVTNNSGKSQTIKNQLVKQLNKKCEKDMNGQFT